MRGQNVLSPASRLDGCLAAGGVETHLESSTGTGHWRSDWEMPAAISPHTCSLFPLPIPFSLSLSLFISQSAGYKSSGYQVQCPCWHFHELTGLCLWCWVPCHSPWASDVVTNSECDWAYWHSLCIYYVAPYMIIFCTGRTVLEMSTRPSDLLRLLFAWLKLALMLLVSDRSNASDACKKLFKHMWMALNCGLNIVSWSTQKGTSCFLTYLICLLLELV